ncbi:MAG: hypothetical protein ACT4RN_03640 [Pseudonocardia sp.]
MSEGLPDQRCRVCDSRCGQDDAAALAWALECDGRGGARMICPDCTRRHARDIEAGLPAEYW